MTDFKGVGGVCSVIAGVVGVFTLQLSELSGL